LEDYAILIAGINTDLSDMTLEEAYEIGDLNGDLKNNFWVSV
jgi:hypothetical protein